MNCPKCGHQNDLNAKICDGCGSPLVDSEQNRMDAPQSTSLKILQPGRGGLILTLGILSLTCFGPIVGIPAWVMGSQDLKKINAGIISMSERGTTKGGMICGIIGTFITPIMVIIGMVAAVGLSLFSSQSILVNKAAIINDLNNIAAYAYQYKISSESAEGGGNSFIGFRLPEDLASNENANYYAQVVSSTSIKLTAVSSQNEENTIIVYVSEDGSLNEWTLTGEFQ
jgi:hypothetical protein